jgi:enoyl-CoA hydratase/carnithine racemase
VTREASDERDQGLSIERRGHAVVLTIDRPRTRNAISRALARRLGHTLRELGGDESVRGVVLTGGGGEVFVSGGDLRDFEAFADDPGGEAEVRRMLLDGLSAIETAPVPVIAAVQGHALGGGCELLCLVDWVTAEEHATFSFRHARMGLTPAWGATSRLLERVGALEASRLLLTADAIDAREARSIGFVNEVVPRGRALEQALAVIARMAEGGRDTVAALKQTLHDVRRAMRAHAFDVEQAAFSARWASEEHHRARAAFRKKKG